MKKASIDLVKWTENFFRPVTTFGDIFKEVEEERKNADRETVGTVLPANEQ